MDKSEKTEVDISNIQHELCYKDLLTCSIAAKGT